MLSIGEKKETKMSETVNKEDGKSKQRAIDVLGFSNDDSNIESPIEDQEFAKNKVMEKLRASRHLTSVQKLMVREQIAFLISARQIICSVPFPPVYQF